MKDYKYYEDTDRNVLYKSNSGVEIRPVLRMKHGINSSNATYYYAWYSKSKERNLWEISTNKLLYGERKVIITCETKAEAEKTSHAINAFIHLLISNV